VYLTIASHLWRVARSGHDRGDRGEFGPMAYAVMVSAMVLLALAVAMWGENLAQLFMDRIEEPGPGTGAE
jgi:hypothetical protein